MTRALRFCGLPSLIVRAATICTSSAPPHANGVGTSWATPRAGARVDATHRRSLPLDPKAVAPRAWLLSMESSGAVSTADVEREAVDALHSLALLAARMGDTPRAARLAGAAEAERARLGCVALRSTLDALKAARASSLERGTEDWDVAWAEGEQLSLPEAITYAPRRRGRRDRAPASPSRGTGRPVRT
jgi:hypothetical protein